MSVPLEWKSEPVSPLLSDAERDTWLLFEDDVLLGCKDDENDVEMVSRPVPTTRAEAAQQLLDDIDNLVKKEETFDWFEEKVDLPIFEEIQPILSEKTCLLETDRTVPIHSTQYHADYFGQGELTPPQSPPATFVLPDEKIVQISFQSSVDLDQLSSLTLLPLHDPTYITLLPPLEKQQSPTPSPQPAFLSAPPTPIPDLAQELAEVDEIVRSRAEALDPTWEWESETSLSGSSPSRASTSDESDDPEWMPSLDKPAPGKASSRALRKSKPYSRNGNVEDKRLRKKEQNKNAATRYRQKKKAEVSEIVEEEKVLEDKNSELEQKEKDLKTEIKYLKGLMRDLFRAKGQLK